MEKPHYPETPTVGQIDDYHGTQVSDPYRWLDNTNSAETEAWIKAQNHLTQTYLEDVPSKEHIRKRLNELWDYPRVTRL